MIIEPSLQFFVCHGRNDKAKHEKAASSKVCRRQVIRLFVLGRCDLGIVKHTLEFVCCGTYSRGFRVRKYVRPNQLDEMRTACEAHRELQAQLRTGRAEYRRTLARARELARMLRNE
jgi:hypothetical protein